jgi:HSP20 family molecular chaperone IbpA
VEAASKYPQASQHYLRRDWHVGLWQLDLPLPRPIDPGRAHATLNLGVLVVMAPIADSTGEPGERELTVSAG